MPQVVTVRVRRPRGRQVRLWIPVLPVLLLLSPLLLLALLALAVACLVYRVSAARALAAGWHVVAALRGTRVEIEQGGTAVLVNVR